MPDIYLVYYQVFSQKKTARWVADCPVLIQLAFAFATTQDRVLLGNTLPAGAGASRSCSYSLRNAFTGFATAALMAW